MELVERLGQALLLLSLGLVLLAGVATLPRLLRVRRRGRLLAAHVSDAAVDLELLLELQRRLNVDNERQLASLRALLRFARRPLVIALWQSHRRRAARGRGPAK